ncbi:MAG: outer membrane protein assembly factor BamB family protein [Thermoguttaceae bacterium]
MCSRLLGLVALAIPAWVQVHWVAAAEARQPDSLLERIGLQRGVSALVGDKECRVARTLARQSELLLYVQLETEQQVAAARRAAEAAGLLGTRIFVEKGPPARIGLADNLADAVVIADESVQVASQEALRVTRPGGKVILRDRDLVKPFPEGIDDWSHHYHGPDNNPQSRDKLARAPYLTQFVVEPRYAPAPQAAVASSGRVYMAFGHVAWHEREEPWLNTLIALNGFNGTMLWKRPLRPGIMVDRCTMIATPTALYLADDQSCKLLDPATGTLLDEIIVPAETAGGTFWKWIALEGGVLYALIGENEPQDPDARWRRTAHGWPWNEMSKLYNDPKHLWGFGKTLLAIDPKTKKVLWKFQEDPPIDSRALGMTKGRIYFCHFGRYLECVDASSGRVVWKRTPQSDPALFEGVGPYRADQGPIQGWKTNNYMKCTDKVLYFAGPQVAWLSAVSAEDGRFLWRHPARDLHIVIRDDGLYTIGPATAADQTKRLDPLTGQVLATYQTRRRSCTRATGSVDSIFFRGHEGSARFDVAAGRTAWISAMRPSCQVGVVVANGHLYWLPWVCDCNLQLFGAICCAPAGSFDFKQQAVEAERLESSPQADAVADFPAARGDWPTYRANNARTARSPASIPTQVKCLWQYTPPHEIQPTAPVAAGGMVFFAGEDGIVRALDAGSGQERWRAYTGGAVHYPPSIAEGRALVGSGDGWAYALEAASGRLLWRFRAAPVPRKILLYGRLLSTWPVASGVLVDQGVAYFAAGINDFDGTHVYALDAASGRIRWQNHAAGHLDEFSLRGVACQGEMLLLDGRLYLAGGNTVSPGVFDAATGQCLNPPPTSMGATAPRGRELVLVSGQVRAVGQPLYSRPEAPVFDPSVRWDEPVVTAANARLACVARRGAKGRSWALVASELQEGRQLWAQPLPAEPVRWGIAVDARGRVFVSLRNGQVLAFGQ